MNAYALIDSATDMVMSFFYWRDQEIASDYPIPNGQYLVEMDEDVYNELHDTFFQGKPVHVKDKTATAFDTMFEVRDKSLDILKDEKKAELNDACNQAILGYFTAQVNGVTYSFSHDSEAQGNFEMADKNLNNGRISSVLWTAYDSNDNVVRLSLDATSFEPVYMAHAHATMDNVSKLRDTLEPRVDAATSQAELDAIVW